MNDTTTTHPSDELPSRWYDIFINRRGFFFFAILLATFLSIPLAGKLRLDESIESMYAPDNPQLKASLASKEAFGGDEFVVVAWKQENLLEQDGLDQIRKFAKTLSEIPGVNSESTQSLAEVLEPEEASFLVRLYLRLPSTQENLLNSSQGILVSEDRKTTAVVLRLKSKDETSTPRSETYATLRKVAAEHNPPAVVVGEPIQVNDMFRYIEDDGRTLGLASTGILLVVIFIMFRSIRWTVIPILVVQISLILMKALLVAAGMRLSMVSTMVDSLVTIVGIATVMHFIVRYREFRVDRSRKAAFRWTLHSLFRPTALTIATTAIGFAALVTSRINPIQTFGLMMAVGTLLVLVSVLCVVPSGALTGKFANDPGKPPFQPVIKNGLLRLTTLVDRAPLLLAILFGGLLIGTGWGLRDLRVETDFSKNFRASSPIVIGLDFFEDRLGGAGNWELNFPAPQELTEDYLNKVRSLSSELKELQVDGKPALTKGVAFTDPTDMIPSMPMLGGTLEKRRALMQQFQPEFEASMYRPGDDKTPGRMRIILRSLERQPAGTKLDVIKSVTDTGKKYFGDDVSATGMFVLLAYLIENLLDDQLVSLLLAAVGIVVVMTLAFHSWRIGLISLLPTVFPIVVLIGGMGWLNMPINIGTAMIASVSLGLTIDSSIHYLKRFYDTFNTTGDLQTALRASHESVGMAMVLANVALIAGFSVLTLSHFLPLVYFGILFSIAMLGGLLGNLLLLPLLLKYIVRPKPITT